MKILGKDTKRPGRAKRQVVIASLVAAVFIIWAMLASKIVAIIVGVSLGGALIMIMATAFAEWCTWISEEWDK